MLKKLFNKVVKENPFFSFKVSYIILFLVMVMASVKFAINYYKPNITYDNIGLVYMQNHDLSFNILNSIFSWISPVMVHGICLVYIILVFDKIYKVSELGSILIISGAISNFIERLVDKYVTDYIFMYIPNSWFYINGFSCNIADIFLVIGWVILILKLLNTKLNKLKWVNYDRGFIDE